MNKNTTHYQKTPTLKKQEYVKEVSNNRQQTASRESSKSVNHTSTAHEKPSLLTHRVRYISELSQDGVGSMLMHVTPEQDEHDVTAGIGDFTKPRAPDGGYGWVVVAATFLSFCTVGFQLGGFSVLYVGLVEHFQSERGVTGWIGSLYGFTGNVFGVIIGAYVQRYGCRVVTLIGAGLGATGIALSSLLINIPYMYLTFGLIGGVGNGLVFLSSQVILQRYFDRRRALAIGIGTSGMSVGAITAVMVLNQIIDRYGLGGAYLISAGVWLQNFIAAALYRPLERRSCKVDNIRDEEHNLKNTKETKYETKDCSISSNNSSLVVNDIITENTTGNKSIFSDFIDFSPMKEPKLVILVLATLLYNIGLMPFYSHYMSRQIHLGIDPDVAVLFQTILAVCTGVSRVLWGFIANVQRINRLLLYAVLVTLSGVTVLTFALVHDVVPIAIYGVMHGLFAGGCFSIQPIVLVDVSGMEHIAKTTGLMNMAISSAILIGIPLAGFVYDVTGSYDLPFVVIGSIQTVGAALLIGLYVLRHTRWKT